MLSAEAALFVGGGKDNAIPASMDVVTTKGKKCAPKVPDHPAPTMHPSVMYIPGKILLTTGGYRPTMGQHKVHFR